jgi:septum site-determining protein MinD
LAPRVITVHSYRRGTGKSIITANLAAQLVLDGARVGLAEVGRGAPSMQYVFGYAGSNKHTSLDQFLDETEPSTATFFHVGGHTADGAPELRELAGRGLWLSPGQTDLRGRTITGESDLIRYYGAVIRASAALHHDFLFLDASALNYAADHALLALAIADLALIVLQPDQQDFQGTATLTSLVDAIGTPGSCVVLNQVPTRSSNFSERTLITTYDVEAAVVLPLAEDLLRFEESKLLSVRQPSHPWSVQIRALARRLPALIAQLLPVNLDAPSLSASIRAQITGREPGIVRRVTHDHDAA